MMSPARNDRSARRLASIAAGSGRRTTRVGVPGGHDAFDFLLEKVSQAACPTASKIRIPTIGPSSAGHARGPAVTAASIVFE